MLTGLRKALRFIVGKMLPLWLLESIGPQLVSAKVMSMQGGDAIKFLMRLDNELYSVQGYAAVAYGNGVHPKHRLTGYHDFFVDHVEAGATVLDVGCGNGAVAHDVAARCNARVLGIDQSEVNILHAKTEFSHPGITYTVGRAPENLPDREFDVVILSNVLEHIERTLEFLSTLIQATRPRIFLIRVPLFERDWRVPLKKELGVDYRLDRTHFIEYTQESFAEEIYSAGLRIAYSEVRWGEIWAQAVAKG
jgi:SAM-dependent methyltransferase